MNSDRYQRGLNKIREIDGDAAEKSVEGLKQLDPDLARYVVEFGFGEVLSRDGLTLRDREIATAAALAALGKSSSLLKVHIHGALNAGCARQEIVEIMIQMAIYAGFPVAINGMMAAKEVFAERDASGRK